MIAASPAGCPQGSGGPRRASPRVAIFDTAARLIGPLAGAAGHQRAHLAVPLWPDLRGIAGRAAMALAGTRVFAPSAGPTMFDGLLTLCTLLALSAMVEAARSGRTVCWLAWRSGSGSSPRGR